MHLRLFVAGGLWGAVQCFRQVLLSWWGPSPDPHHAATQALLDREVRGAVPRASLQITTCAEDPACPLHG